MGRGNKAVKERKAKAREERESKAREENKLVEASNNGAVAEPSIPVEVAQANEDQRSQETANGSLPINERGKELRWENEGTAEALKMEETPGDGGKFKEASSIDRLQPSELEARQRSRVETSNRVPNKDYNVGYSAQSSSRGWGDSRTAANGRGGVKGGYVHQVGQAKSNTVEFARGIVDERLQENGNGKEFAWVNEATVVAMKTEGAPSGWAQHVKRENGSKWEYASVVRLQPSNLDARQKPRVEGLKTVENKVCSVLQSHSDRGGDFKAVGNGRGAGRGSYGHPGYFRAASNGRGGGRGGYGSQASESQVDDFTRIDSLGRLLSSVLRHRAVELGLNMRSDGYVLVQDLLNLRLRTHAGFPISSHTVDDIKQVVKADNKQRFGLREESGQLLIRANQGHSVMVVSSEDLLTPVNSPEEVPVCVHGTYFKYIDKIRKEGLKRMSRRHIHFATGLFKEKRVISGMRGSSEVLIYLNVEKYLKDGMKLYRSENGVILAEGENGVIPPTYFANIEQVQH